MAWSGKRGGVNDEEREGRCLDCSAAGSGDDKGVPVPVPARFGARLAALVLSETGASIEEGASVFA